MSYKNIILTFAALSFAVTCFAYDAVVVYPESFPPFFIQDSSGHTDGFGIQVLKEIEKRTNLHFKYQPVKDWDTAFEMIKTNKAQIAPDVGISPERQEFAEFSIPIDTSDISIITLKDSKIKNINDLSGKNAATVKAGVIYGLLKAQQDVEITGSDSYTDLVYRLMSGSADAIIAPYSSVSDIIHVMGIRDKIKVIEPPIYSVKRSIAVAKSSSVLFGRLNSELSKYETETGYKNLYAQWHKDNKDKVSPLRLFKILVSLVFIGCIVFLVLRIKRLIDKDKKLKIEIKAIEQDMQKLRDSDLRFRTMAENIGDVIWFATGDMKKFLFMNKSYERIFGLSPESIYENPSNYLECVHPDDLEKMTLHKGNITQAKTNIKYRVINKQTGELKWVLSHYYPFKDENGNILFFSGIISDITPLVEADNERTLHRQTLAQQSKFASLGEMVGAISHQWRQPLNSLYLIVQMIQDACETEIKDEEYIRKYLSESMTLIEHMSETIDDFRDFFKPEKKPEPFDAPRTVLQIIRMFAPQLKVHNINYHLDCKCAIRTFSCVNNYDPGNPPCKNLVFGVSNEFKHAVLNLIQNAKEALDKSQSREKDVFINMSSDSKEFTITITDSAGGIDPKIITRIFDPYFTMKEEGTGMGLYITKTIIEDKMNGKITAENTDIGAKFTITLPVVKEEEKPQP